MPIPRMKVKQLETPAPRDEASVKFVNPGRYKAEIIGADVQEGKYKSGYRIGKSYQALRVSVMVETPKGAFALNQILWPNSKPETTLFHSLGLEDAQDYEPAELVGKTVGIYVDRNRNGYLDIVEFSRESRNS